MASIQNADNHALTQTIIYASPIPEKIELRREVIE